jgi:hypothetical protein
MPEKVLRPSYLQPLTRPQHERTDMHVSELQEFWRIVLRAEDMDWGTMRIWSHILFRNSEDVT